MQQKYHLFLEIFLERSIEVDLNLRLSGVTVPFWDLCGGPGHCPEQVWRVKLKHSRLMFPHMFAI